MKKYCLFFTLTILVFSSLLSVNAKNSCLHIHNKNCGYNEETGEGCTHDCKKDGHEECNPLLRMGCMYCPD